jgi:hypothetical protein
MRSLTSSILGSWKIRLAACGVVVFLIVVWDLTPPYSKGVVAAYLDHVRLHHAVKWSGDWRTAAREAGLTMHQRVGEPYHRLLRERYGLEIELVNSGFATGKARPFANGYNSVSLRVLRGKYGRDIFRECAALAVQHPDDEDEE